VIRLHTDCLVFDPAADLIPCSAEQVIIELAGAAPPLMDPELVRQAAVGVLEYFRRELRRDYVSVGEFCEALAAVLRGFGLEVGARSAADAPTEAVQAAEGQGPSGRAEPGAAVDLRRLACESGKAFELAFFPRLRAELEWQLSDCPRVLRFTGLRSCVKQLAGARRWSIRCQQLSDQIVDYLRVCLRENKHLDNCAMVVV
jgi:hypothetical protein